MRAGLLFGLAVLVLGTAMFRAFSERDSRVVVDEVGWGRIPVSRIDGPPRVVSVAPIDFLEGRAVINPAEGFAFLTSIAVDNGFALVTDLGFNPHAAVVDLRDGQIIERFASGNGGRHHLIDPRVVHFSRSNGVTEGWLWGARTNRLVRIGGGAGEETRVVWSCQLLFPQQMTRPRKIESGFVAGGYFDDAVVLFLSRRGRATLRVSGAEPNQVADSLRTNLTGMVNRSIVAAVGGRIAVAFQWSDRIVILDAEGRVLAIGDGPVGVSTTYEIVDGSPHFAASQISAYRDIAASDRGVFVLFQGGRIGSDTIPNSQVHFFDWEGHLQRIFQLDAVLSSFDVWEGSIFGVEGNSPSQIIRFQLEEAGGL